MRVYIPPRREYSSKQGLLFSPFLRGGKGKSKYMAQGRLPFPPEGEVETGSPLFRLVSEGTRGHIVFSLERYTGGKGYDGKLQGFL